MSPEINQTALNRIYEATDRVLDGKQADFWENVVALVTTIQVQRMLEGTDPTTALLREFFAGKALLSAAQAFKAIGRDRNPL